MFLVCFKLYFYFTFCQNKYYLGLTCVFSEIFYIDKSSHSTSFHHSTSFNIFSKYHISRSWVYEAINIATVFKLFPELFISSVISIFIHEDAPFFLISFPIILMGLIIARQIEIFVVDGEHFTLPYFLYVYFLHVSDVLNFVFVLLVII